MMKMILFFVVIIFTTTLQAQHSDLYNYIDSLTKTPQFPRCNVFQIKYSGVFAYDNQPALMVDDSLRVKNMNLFTKFEDLDSYTMSQVQSIQIWNKGSWIQCNLFGIKGFYGAIFIYTKTYITPNPVKPNLHPLIVADEDDQKQVIYLAPILPILPPLNNKGKKE